MAKKTKAVTKYRRRSNGGERKIPMAIVAGMIPGISWGLESVQAGNWQGAGERLMLAYTGIRPSPFTFTTGYLGKGLYPLLFGMLAHALATRFGLNRMIGKFGLPIEI